MEFTIYFDMDGTIADLYGVENWLDYLIASDALPYEIAKPLIRLNSLARILNRLQKQGCKIGIISWLAKGANEQYDTDVKKAKEKWLKKHLTSVNFDEIHIVKYGTPKEKFAKTKNDILFDDELVNRENWTGKAFDVDKIIEILKEISLDNINIMWYNKDTKRKGDGLHENINVQSKR